jgi:hypothetical protein
MKIKLIILIALIAIFPLSLFSQLSIQFTSLNNYLFNTKEALNLTVINSGVKSVQVQFSGRIVKSDIGNVTFFKTEPLILNVGANIITPTSISLNEINYLDNDIREIEQKTGTYPSGNYTVCIWSACTSPDCDGSGQSAGSIEQPVCTNISIENPTPLILSYPSNDSEIEETRPTYTWIPPAPVAASSSLNYTMTLVEILDGQSKSDALALNRPLIELSSISNPMLMHPADLPDLEPGKSYAWQVQAYIGQTFFAKSEQWKFKVKKKEDKKVVGKLVVILKPDDKDIHSAEDTLRMVFNEPKKSGKINLVIKSQNGLTVEMTDVSTKFGENLIWIDLLDPKYKINETYQVIFIEGNKILYQLKFVVRR